MNTIILDNLKVLTHDNIPVITTELLANLYGTEVIRVQQNYNRNNNRFIEGKHFFKITGECLNNLRLSFSESQISPKLAISYFGQNEEPLATQKCLKQTKHGMYSNN